MQHGRALFEYRSRRGSAPRDSGMNAMLDLHSIVDSDLTEAQPLQQTRRSIKKLLLPLFLQVGTTAHNLRADSAGFWRSGEDRYWLPRLIFRGYGAGHD